MANSFLHVIVVFNKDILEFQVTMFLSNLSAMIEIMLWTACSPAYIFLPNANYP